MINLQTKIVILILMAMVSLSSALPEQRTFKVGVAEAAPYAMKNPNGQWEGISVEFWQSAADMQGINYEYQEYNDYGQLVKDVAAGKLDAGIGQISALEMNDATVDFTHAYFFSGLAIAAPKLTERQHWMKVLQMLGKTNFVLISVLILITLAVSGVSVWLVERRRNAENFPSGMKKGIWAGIWWSASTITTIGYGDKVPVTFWGRFLAICWMVIGIILVSVFTATITSMATVSRLGTPTGEIQDLYRQRVAAVAGSAAETFLQRNAVEYEQVPTTVALLQLLAEGRADMAVDDQAILKYYCRRQKALSINLLPTLLTMQGYSFVLAKNSPLREPLNQAIMKFTATSAWQNVLLKYLGN